MALTIVLFLLNPDLQNPGINWNWSFLAIWCCWEKNYSKSLYVYTIPFKESKVKAIKCKIRRITLSICLRSMYSYTCITTYEDCSLLNLKYKLSTDKFCHRFQILIRSLVRLLCLQIMLDASGEGWSSRNADFWVMLISTQTEF